ncbi:unnamed protein product [Rodentolepis nana]|uniref:DSHCT domain-containing protein n=1 Tax=Rodentolepis nana TaxID=102285 RepID=A0A0R3TFR0_RODNA|nr:unnamed protein product [Rodentolepis nana]
MDLASLPIILRKELVFQHNLSPERAGCLIDHLALLSLYISTSKFALNQSESVKNTIFAIQNIGEKDFPHLVYREVAFWCTGQLYSGFRDKPEFCLPSDELLSQFVIMNLTGDIFGTGSEQVLNEMCEARESSNVLELAERLGVLLNHDLCTIKSACSEFIENNSKLVEKYIRKGRKHRNLLSMVRRIVLDHKDPKRLHEGLVERCLSDMFDIHDILVSATNLLTSHQSASAEAAVGASASTMHGVCLGDYLELKLLFALFCADKHFHIV